MPQTKAKLVRGKGKMLSTKGRTSKKLKAKRKLLKDNPKVLSNNHELSKTPKDNGNQDLLNTNGTLFTKKNIPHVKPNSQEETPFLNLNRLPTVREKISVNQSKKSSDKPKCLENDLQYNSNKIVLTNQEPGHDRCDPPNVEEVKSINVNTSTALPGNKARKRRKPLAHVNNTVDRSLSPIVLLERLSIEKIKQSIFTTKEQLDTLNSSKDIDNDISENVNPSKRRKTSLNHSNTKRKSQSILECETPPVCCEQESLVSTASPIKKNKKTPKVSNVQNRSFEKLASKTAVNTDNSAEEINPNRNEQSQIISKKDQSNFQNNQFKNEKSGNSRKTSLRQKIQDAPCKNKSEDGISQNDIESEKMISEPKDKKEQNTLLTQKKCDESKINANKNKSAGKKIENISVSTRSKNKLENNSVNEKEKTENEDHSECKSDYNNKLKNEKFLDESVSRKRKNKSENTVEHEKGKNLPVVDKSPTEHKKEGIQNKRTDKKIRNISVTRKNQNQLRNKEPQNKSISKENLNGQEKSNKINDSKGQSESRSSPENLEKSLNESISENCQNASENVEGIQSINHQNNTECSDNHDKQNLSSVSNTYNATHESDAITLNTIKSEVESDDADSSEENEVLNIKIFEMDDAININEDDLVSTQLKRSMRVESEQFTNNEVVNVKIFQIEKHQDEAKEETTSNNESITDTLKTSEEKKIIDSSEKRIGKSSKDIIEADETVFSDELISDKANDIKENDQEKNVTLNRNEIVEHENDTSKKKVVIKVKIVKIDNSLTEDCANQLCDNKTSNDQVQEEKISSASNYLMDSDKIMDSIDKTSNTTPEKIVSEIIEDNLEIDNTTNYPEFAIDKSNKIKDKIIDTSDKISDQENTKFEEENEVEINNDIVKIKIFENDKALDIEDYFSEPCTEPGIEQILEDKVEVEESSIINELNNSTLMDADAAINVNETINDSDENQTQRKSFIQNIQKKIKELGEKKRKNWSSCTSNNAEEKTKEMSPTLQEDFSINFCEKNLNNVVENTIETEKGESSKNLKKTKTKIINEKVLIDSTIIDVSNVAKNIVEAKKTKININLTEKKSKTTKEISPINCLTKGITNTVKDKIKVDETTNRNALIVDESTGNKEIAATDLCVPNVSQTIETKIEAHKSRSRNDVSKLKSNTTEKSLLETCKKSVDNKVEDKLVVEKDKSSNALDEKKLEAIEQKTLINSSVKSISTTPKKNESGKDKSMDNKKKTIRDKIETDESECNTKVNESKSNAAVKESLIKPCAITVSKIVEKKLEAVKDKSSNQLNDEISKASKEETLTILSEKTINNSIKNKSAKGELNKDKSIDNNKKVAIVNKIETEKTDNSNDLSKAQLDVTNEKSLPTSCVKRINMCGSIKMVKDKIEAEQTNDEKSKRIKENFSVDSCPKRIDKIPKDKVEEDKTEKEDALNKDKSENSNEKKLSNSSSKSVSKTKADQIEVPKSAVDKLSNKNMNDIKEKVVEEDLTDDISVVKKKTEETKTKSNNELLTDKSRAINKKSLIDSCNKIVSNAVEEKEKKKTSKDNVISKKKPIDINEEKLSDSGVNIDDKVKNDKVLEKSITDKDTHNKNLNDGKKKVAVEPLSNTISNNVTVEEKEKKKTSKDNVISKKKPIDINEEKLSDSGVNTDDKVKNDKVLEKSITDKDTHNKNLNDGKKKVAVEPLSNTISNNVKKKSEDGKSKIINELDVENPRTIDSEIVSSKKSVNKTVKIIEEKILSNNSLNKDNSIINEKSMSDSSVKDISKTKIDKEKVSVEPCVKTVSESVKDKIEAEEINNKNNASKGQLKKTEEILLNDTSTQNTSEIIRDKIELEKATRKSNIDKSNKVENKSINPKNVSESMNISIEEEISTPNQTQEKSKKPEKESVIDTCVQDTGINEINKHEAIKTKANTEQSDKTENVKEKALSETNAKIDVPEKDICSKEMEVESNENLTTGQENNSVILSTLNIVSSESKPKKIKKKKPNKYRRLKKHMIRKRKKKNRVKIRSNEIIKTKSSKMMQLLGTICMNKIQEKSKSSKEIEQPYDAVISTPLNESVPKKTYREQVRESVPTKKYRDSIRESVPTKRYRDSIRESVPTKRYRDSVFESLPTNTYRDPIRESVPTKAYMDAVKLSVPKRRYCYKAAHKKTYRDPITGKFCSKAVPNCKISVVKTKNTEQSATEAPADLRRNNSVRTKTQDKLISNSNEKSLNSSVSSSDRLKTSDTSRNTTSSQSSSSKGKDNIPNQNCTQPLENLQDEITIEEHEIKIEDDLEVMEIIIEEEAPNNINYVTASEIFNRINSKENESISRMEILKNLRSILPLNKGSAVRTSCTNVNNVRNNISEHNEERYVPRHSEGNLHRHVEPPSRSRASLTSQHVYNNSFRDVSGGLYKNARRNNYRSINTNSFDDSVASTSAMSISVREAFEKISFDLLGAYNPQYEEDHQGYSNGINDLLHIADSDNEQLNASNVDSDHNVTNDSSFNHSNYQPLVGASTSSPDAHSNVVYKKPVKKKNIDEAEFMILECPRCFVDCIGMKRLQRHYHTCGPPPLFTCTICCTKLKQKRSLASHYLSYHGELVNEDTLQDVIAETVRRSQEERNEVMNSTYLTIPNHVSVFCDQCQKVFDQVPASHRLSCQSCMKPLMYYCEKCSRRQSLALRMQIHVQSKCTEEPNCPHCGFVAASLSLLQEHVVQQHAQATAAQRPQPAGVSEQGPLLCHHGCGRGFKLRLSRKRHEAHCAKDKDQLCRFCPFKTKHRSVIKVHMQNHMINNDFTPRQSAPNNFVPDDVAELIEAYCQACKCVFETPVYAGTRCPQCHACALYRCRRCTFTDTVYREMRRHITQTHFPQTLGMRGRPPMKSRTCRRCGERFKDNPSLKRHERATGKCRPCCRRCGKTFFNVGSLKRHVKVNCGVEARLRCDHCSFITKTRFSLVRHMQAQHAEDYNGGTVHCTTCDVVFNNIYLYENHNKYCGEAGGP